MSWTFTHKATLTASPATVFGALTTPSALTSWFAEQVEIGDCPGAPFRFWGKHSLETPTASHATQSLIQFAPDELLAYTWSIGQTPTVVTISLQSDTDGKRTKVMLEHEINGTLAYARAEALIDDWWRLTLANLTAFLDSGRGLMLPNFTETAPVIRQSIVIDAPRHVVFQALITPALVNQWLGANNAVIEPHVGGRFELGWHYQIAGVDVVGGPTRILEYVENKRLALDWPDWRGDTTVTGQTISFSLSNDNGQTRVDFTHAGFVRATDVSDYAFGWAEFLEQLRCVIATS